MFLIVDSTLYWSLWKIHLDQMKSSRFASKIINVTLRPIIVFSAAHTSGQEGPVHWLRFLLLLGKASPPSPEAPTMTCCIQETISSLGNRDKCVCKTTQCQNLAHSALKIHHLRKYSNLVQRWLKNLRWSVIWEWIKHAFPHFLFPL